MQEMISGSFAARRDWESKKWKFSVANRYREGKGGGVLGAGNKIYHGNCAAQHPASTAASGIILGQNSRKNSRKESLQRILERILERTGGLKARLVWSLLPRL